jgi:hypothetical protein
LKVRFRNDEALTFTGRLLDGTPLKPASAP